MSFVNAFLLRVSRHSRHQTRHWSVDWPPVFTATSCQVMAPSLTAWAQAAFPELRGRPAVPSTWRRLPPLAPSGVDRRFLYVCCVKSDDQAYRMNGSALSPKSATTRSCSPTRATRDPRSMCPIASCNRAGTLFSVRSARDGVICALASTGECANAVYHPRGGQDLGPPTRLAVLLVGRRVGRRRDRPEQTVVLAVGTGREKQRVGARFGTAAQGQGPQARRSPAACRRGRQAHR